MNFTTHEKILESLNWRYAVQAFNPQEQITENELNTVLESGRLAPSSYGIEPWKFIVVQTKELREKLRAVSYGQPKVTEASHIIVIARRTDVRQNIVKELIERTAKAQGVDISALRGLQDAVEFVVNSKNDIELDAWIRAQTYIPLGIMIETASLLGIDNGPMEGFNVQEVDKLLKLDQLSLTATTMLALGKRGDDKAALRKKTRRSFNDVVLHM